MPRLTDASRRARREAIADAALRVFERQGVAHASTADIIEELGGSAGGVYSHFASKAELIQFIAGRALTEGLDAISGPRIAPGPPAAVLRVALSEMVTRAPIGVIVQLWGEAVVDPDMRAVVLSTLDQVQDALQQAVLPWAETLPGDAAARAHRAARAMRAVAQGYIVQLALDGSTAADHYLDELTELLNSTD